MIFTDTSALFALLVANDRNHRRAVHAEARIRHMGTTLWTIDPVLTELWLLLRREVGRAYSDRLIRGLLDRGLRCEAMPPGVYDRAWDLSREWADQDFSLTDRQAFAAIEQSGDYRAWSYDEDFAIIRLGRRRTIALELV